MYKVVCIRTGVVHSELYKVVEGEIYTVIKEIETMGVPTYMLAETGEAEWKRDRLRNIDHQFGQNLAKEIETELNEQYLIPSL